jgi:hypothetical protein
VRAVDKIEAGQPFIAAKGTLQAIIHQQQRMDWIIVTWQPA